jgi:hypothetical protein
LAPINLGDDVGDEQADKTEDHMISMKELLHHQISAIDLALADTCDRLSDFESIAPLSGAPLSKELARFLDALVTRVKKLTGTFQPGMYGTAPAAKPAAKQPA